MHRRITLASSSILFLGLATALPALADDASPALDRVSVWVGGTSIDTKVGVDASANDVGTGHVDLANGRENVGRARLDFLFLDSQGFSFDYYTLSRKSSKSLDQPFSYQGDVFQVDSTINGKFDLSAGSAAYHWWFGSANDVVGFGLGGAWYRVKFALDGTITVNDQSAAGGVQWSDDAAAPLLTVAYKHAFSDSVRLYFDASGVRKNSGNLQGHLYDGRVGLEWFPWQHFGVGAEYGVTRIHLDHTGSNYDADLNVHLDGPSLFARARF